MWRFLLPLIFVSTASAQGLVMSMPLQYEQREKQAKYDELRDMGVKAIPILTEMAKGNDAEERLQAERLLIEAKSLEIWEATPINFNSKVLSLTDTIRLINEQMGRESVELLTSKTMVNLNSGAFWPVLDDVCAQTKLRPNSAIVYMSRSLKQIDLDENHRSTSTKKSYDGACRLELTSLARTQSSTIDFEGDNSHSKRMAMSFSLYWEPKLTVLGHVMPSVEAVTNRDLKLMDRSRSANWCFDHYQTLKREFSCEIQSPALGDRSLKTIRVKIPLLGSGFLLEKEVDLKGNETQASLYFARLDSAVHDSVKKEWHLQVVVDHIIGGRPSDDESLHEVFLRPCSIYIRKGDGKRVDPSHMNLSDAHPKEIVLGPLETAIDLVSGPPPSQGEYLIEARFQGLEKEDMQKLIFVYPEVRSRKELIFEFNNVDLPVID